MKAKWIIFSVMAVLLASSIPQASGQTRRRKTDQNQQVQYNDQDRQTAKDWYNQNRDHAPAGLREEDRKPEYEQRIQPGVVLDRNLRREVHPVPPELARKLSRPPRGYRHVAVGGQIVLVDSKYHVHDAIHPER